MLICKNLSVVSLSLATLFVSLNLGTAWADPDAGGEKSVCNTVMMGKGISQDWLDQQMKRIAEQHPAMTRLQTAVRMNGLKSVAVNEEILKNHNSNYTYILKGQAVTDQKQTGRCWIFSAQSVMRASLLNSGLLPPNFEISENYVWFYALLERSNAYVEELMSLTGRKLKAGEIQMLAKPQISEGGFFASFVEIINKYGVVPKSAMPETSGSLSSGVTGELELMLSDFSLAWNTEKEAFDALRAKNGGKVSAAEKRDFEERLRAKKEETMTGIYQILITHLGVPPRDFNVRLSGSPSNLQKAVFKKYGTKPGTAIAMDGLDVKMTPMELLELTGFQNEEWITVAYRPMKPYGLRYQLEGGGEIVSEKSKVKPLELYNVPMERLIGLTEKALLAGYPVEFDANMGPQVDNGSGIMHPDLFDTDPVYGGYVDRKELMKSRMALSYLMKNQANHAMTIVGIDHPDLQQAPIKFLVQNSWSDKAGQGGYYHMYREWMEKYVENINIPKSLLTPKELEMFARPAVVVKNYRSLYRPQEK